MTEQAILITLLPLLAAPLCLIISNLRVSAAINIIACGLCFIVAIGLFSITLDGTIVTYHLGGWAPPWGIEYRIDRFSSLLALLISGMAFICAIFAPLNISRHLPIEQHHLFHAAYLLGVAGLIGIVVTGDAFNVFVFLEISSLATYALIALGHDRRALIASYQYLILGTIGATFFLIGVGFLYAMTGTLNMQDLALRIPAVAETRAIHAAFAFLVVGICLKLALFPLHFWLPNAYTYAPGVISAFLAATATKVAIYLLFRFLLTLFGEHFSFATMRIHHVLLPLSLIGIVVASLAAIYQTGARRALAYSSVAQVGYIILAFCIATPAGYEAALIHMVNHAVIKGGLFLALAAMAFRVNGSLKLSNIAGIGRQMPWTFAAFCIGGLSLIGVPLTAGFISKWFLLKALLETNWWPLAILVLLSSLLAVIYIWRIVEAAWFRPVPANRGQVGEAPWMLLIPTLLIAALNIYLGIQPEFLLNFVTETVQQLILK